MCGIIGYIGQGSSVPVLIEGLEKLAYRGYDSSGIAFIDNHHITVQKAVGKLGNLTSRLIATNDEGIGIGHTRWATHGPATFENAHPHLSAGNKIAVVHNGIIENHLALKNKLAGLGYTHYVSETDTEVIAHLIEHYYLGSNHLLQAVHQAVEQMEGSYAIAVLAADRPDEIIAVRKNSPLIVGLGEGENYLASDVPAILSRTRQVMYLNDDEFASIRRDSVTIYDSSLHPVTREISQITWDMTQAEKGGYDTFTLKEIHEQPKALAETINHRIKQGVIDLSLDLPQEDLQALKRIYIVACGTAYHAGLIGKRLIEQLVELPVQVEIASEFRSVVPFLSPDDLVIAVSQSGETIDTLQAVRMARSAGAKIISILNVVGSSLARESDGVLYTWAGPEIGVASTKAYTTQVASLALLALQMKQQLDPEADKMVQEILTELQALPETVEQILGIEQEIIELADQQAANERIIFMGRGVDYYTALEASLKLKEISYINCLAMPAGEMKHGTIALVEDGSWVVGFLTQSETYDKMISNLKEVRARGAKVLAITTLSDEALADASDHIIHLPQVNQAFAPMISVIPAQLLAYYIATARGLDVDQPRNLAKSVTVE